MHTECYPISTLAGTSAIFREFADPGTTRDPAVLRRWYPADPFSMDWARLRRRMETFTGSDSPTLFFKEQKSSVQAKRPEPTSKS